MFTVRDVIYSYTVQYLFDALWSKGTAAVKYQFVKYMLVAYTL
jgi:hypothetical protein